jgi:uncharacterized protein involved in tellurium resistance
MRKIKVLLFVLILAFIFDGCKKTKDVNGVVLITVEYNGKYMPNTTVYMKKSAVANPSIALSAYDQNNTTNSSGQVYFEDLPEDKYYFYVKTKNGPDTITGGVASVVTLKPRPNLYDLTIGLAK